MTLSRLLELSAVELTDFEDYEVRLIQEYQQLIDRLRKLDSILDKWYVLNFDPMCSYEQLARQRDAMNDYRISIENRNDFIKIVGELDG